MAPPVAEAVAAPAGLAQRLLEATPGRLAFALRMALVCTLAALVTQVYGTPSPALTTYLSFFVFRPDRVASVLRAVALTLLFTAVLGLTVLVAQQVIDSSAWRFAAMAAISLALMFLASASKLRTVASIVAMIMAYALAQLGAAPDGELATRALLYVWLFIAIPAGASLVVALLASPSPRALLQRALAGRLRVAARALRDPDGAAAGALLRLRRAGDEELATLVKFAGAERSSPRRDIVALHHATGASSALLAAVDFGVRTPRARLARPLADALVRTLDQMASILERGGYPVDVTPPAAPAGALNPLAAAHLAAIVQALARFAEPVGAPAPAPAPAARAGLLAADAFTNPEHVRHALKATAAAMGCYLVYQVLDWPGIHTCLITCYIVALGTVADSVEKLALRLAGCLAGAALGIAAMVFVVPALDSITGLLATVFAGTLLAAWVAAGSPRIAYAGLQLAFAFLLCVLQGAGPAFDLTVARDRLIGIAVGNAMVYAVFTLCWPVSVAARVDNGLAAVMRQLASLARAADPSSSRRLAAQAQAAIGVVEGDVELARYEPGRVRATDDRLAQALRTVAAAAALEPTLQLAAAAGANDAAIAARLARLADPAAPAVAPAPAGDERDPLRVVVEARLRALEQTVAAPSLPPELRHAPA